MTLRRLCSVAMILTMSAACSPAQAEKQSVASWVKGFKQQARAEGISQKVLDEALNGFQPIAKIIRLDRHQPDGTTTFEKYMKSTLPPFRVNKGRKLYQKHRALLNDITEKYGVPGRFIIALWGKETSYGGYTGGYSVPHALATLAYDGRREELFTTELINALKIIDQGHITFKDMKGSWAGAMGQSQFMPTSFLKYAVDYNGDGRRDIWNTEADVFASIANYLSTEGWDDEYTWGRKVTLPKGFDRSLAQLKTFRPLREYQEMGVRTEWNADLPNVDLEAALIFGGKDHGPAYLIYPNYNVILKWNYSRYFATAVGTLADRIAK